MSLLSAADYQLASLENAVMSQIFFFNYEDNFALNKIQKFSQIDQKNAFSALKYSIVKSGANKILKR